MEYRKLGASELVVSEIALGSWLTYGGAIEDDRGRACVDRAFDIGINFFDTANIYGRDGAAESFLGEALAGRDRSSYVLATKAYFPMSPNDRGLSATQVAKQCDASLRRLRTDHVDLYQCHRYDADTPLEETMGALTALVTQGKARYIGFSEWAPDQIRAAAAIPDVARFVSSQPEYSILYRKPEPEVFGLCAASGIGQIVWSPLAQGALTGKYRPGQPPPPGSRAAGTEGRWMGRWQADDVLAAVQGLRPLADEAGLTMAQLALAWVLRRPEVTAAIVGASRPEQLDDNAAASGRHLDSGFLDAVDAAVAGVVGWG
ncbi:MAG: aldo/keto reductase family protein [Acidimicrobiales bacterium]